MPITIVCVVLALIALAGYLRPAATQEMPTRLLFAKMHVLHEGELVDH